METNGIGSGTCHAGDVRPNQHFRDNIGSTSLLFEKRVGDFGEGKMVIGLNVRIDLVGALVARVM